MADPSVRRGSLRRKLGESAGVATRSGGDYDIYSLTYVYAW